MPGSAVLLIRLLLTVVFVAAAWRFGAPGVLTLLAAALAVLLLLKRYESGRERDD